VVEKLHVAELRRGEPRLPILIDGARAGPHEDSGGRWSHAEMLKALRNRRHPQHRQYRDWIEPTYDPERFDPWLAGQNLMLAAAWGRDLTRLDRPAHSGHFPDRLPLRRAADRGRAGAAGRAHGQGLKGTVGKSAQDDLMVTMNPDR
jgi:hypothetical protein